MGAKPSKESAVSQADVLSAVYADPKLRDLMQAQTKYWHGQPEKHVIQPQVAQVLPLTEDP
jgi:hypothetical protein